MSGYLQQNQNNTQPKSCERIVQGVAKLSTFRIPSTHLKRCSEGAIPLNEQTINSVQPKIVVNGNINGKEKKEFSEDTNWPNINLSPSTTNCLRVSSSGIDISTNSSGLNENCSGKRLYSLDSSTTNMSGGGGRSEWNNSKNQQFLVTDTTEIRLKRDRKWWNRTAASYCFLFISIILSLSVVIGVCLFLYSFIPKDYYNKNIIKNNENINNNNTINSNNSLKIKSV
ncbi:hypothetical protein ACQ4LE_001835 [Meloidogyne hapla]